MRPGRVPAAAAVAVAATAVLVPGCDNSQPAATQPGTRDHGRNAKVGQVRLRDVEVTTGVTGASRDATVRLTLVNQAAQSDALTAVASDVAGRVEMLAVGPAAAGPPPSSCCPPGPRPTTRSG